MEPSDNLSTTNTPVVIIKKTFWDDVREWIQVIVIALLISLPIRFFIAEPFIVNGASMDPTFATGQFLIVDRLTYRLEAPSRGDVIVFEYPNNPSTYYIKRIIGLPGETLDIKDGTITISNPSSTSTIPNNQTVLKEPYVKSIHRSYDTFHTNLGPTEYFVMGDNRAESSDSRLWGPLDKHYIVGRPIVRLLPITTMSILPGEYNQ
ncbi:MAG: signal peptidase I [Candidatus Paceibacterota bacterium]|jgi:signal peptidase I